MIYTGIDHHKRYSVACALDAQGRKLLEKRIDHNSPEAFEAEAQEKGGVGAVSVKVGGKAYLDSGGYKYIILYI